MNKTADRDGTARRGSKNLLGLEQKNSDRAQDQPSDRTRSRSLAEHEKNRGGAQPQATDGHEFKEEKLLLVLRFTLMISVLNGSVFNLVLPDIARTYRLAPSQVSWVAAGYMLVYAVGSVVYGKLADRWRLRSLLTFGLVFFAVGSSLGAAAQSFGMVVAARVLQAAGSSVVPAAAMLVPVRFFPPERRGRALASNAVGTALGNAAGPVAAALIAGFAGWRFLFLLALLALIALPFLWRLLAHEPPLSGTPLDIAGALLLTGAALCLLLAVTRLDLPLAVMGIGLAALFVRRIRTARAPFVDPALFASRRYSLGLAIAFAANGIGFSLPFLMPQLLAQVNGLASSRVGWVMLPGALTSVLLGRRGGRYADKHGTRALFRVAAALQAACCLLLSTYAGGPVLVVGLIYVAGYLGQTLMLVALSGTVAADLRPEHAGVGMGFFSMLTFLSSAATATVLGRLLDLSMNRAINPFQQHPAAYGFSNLFAGELVLLVAIIFAYSSLSRVRR
ncbi:MFS transporter [Gorillibacterium sp. CAU 1737]|uniref:MFS transporter n=1 Tax=Gorillibacterium sp. CAU 1737 TaxID=3140362 RepID=UPI0032605B07